MCHYFAVNFGSKHLRSLITAFDPFVQCIKSVLLSVLGMMTSTVTRDRVIVQTIMMLVASSVVILLKIKAK